MKTIGRLFLLYSFLSCIVNAQTMKPTKQSKAGAPGNAKFLAMADRLVKESLALSPVNASQAGYHKHLDAKTGKTIMLDRELDDVGATAMAAQAAFYRHWRRRFHTETPVASLNAQDAVMPKTIRLNMFKCPRLNEAHARTKNGDPPHNTTGVPNAPCAQFNHAGPTQ